MGQQTLKVFASGAAQDELVKQYPPLARYDAFAVVDVPEGAAAALGKSHLVEDITDQYAIKVGDRVIDTGTPRVTAAGVVKAKAKAKAGANGAAAADKLKPGKHHYLVQFVGPVKKEWLAGVKKAGGEVREPSGGFVYIVRMDDKTVPAVRGLPYVRWVGHLPHGDRIAAGVTRGLGRKNGDAAGQLPRTRVLPGVYTVEFFGPKDVTAAVPAVKKLGFTVLTSSPDGRLMVVKAKEAKPARQKQITALSGVHGVREIRERSLDRPSNNVATTLMGTLSTAGIGGAGLGLAGQGEVIAVCDTGLDSGDPQHIHPDFAKRVAFIKSYPITPDISSFINNPQGDDGPADLDSGHGTHVSGSILGDGTSSKTIAGLAAPVRGLAHKAKLVFQAVEQEVQWKDPADLKANGRFGLWGIPADLKGLLGDAYAKKARIHSNSWGGGDPGVYDEQCRQLDEFVWEHKDFCVLVAAGNDGTDKDADGKINPMSVTSPGTAKNCITVGACENNRPDFNGEVYGDWWPDDYPIGPFKADSIANDPNEVVPFSSRGPCQDGRTKPEVVSPGTFILSTRSRMLAPNNFAWAKFPQSKLYFYMGGTSMATPLTAGAVALVREFLRKKKKIKKPTAALLKAALVAGATRLPKSAASGAGSSGSLCDNAQGYGRVNLDGVLAPAAPAAAQFVEVKPGLATGGLDSRTIQVKSGTVPLRVVLAYSDFPGAALVNNLNLVVTAPDGKRFVGNDGSSGTGGVVPLDASNNVEAVNIASPAAGKWTVEVIGANVPHGPQEFALVIVADV